MNPDFPDSEASKAERHDSVAHPPTGRDLVQKSSSGRKGSLKERRWQAADGWGDQGSPLSVVQMGTWKGLSRPLLGGRPGEWRSAQGT